MMRSPRRRRRGVTARITFTNKLVDSASLQGSDPLLTGGTGRLWASKDRLRLELQASPDRGGGDVQIQVRRRRRVGLRQRLEHGLPGDASSRQRQAAGDPLRRPHPAAPRPALPARRGLRGHALERRRATGLLRSASRHARTAGCWAPSSWLGTQANGVPLRAGVYAAGAADPVLELKATDVAFGRVPGSSLSVPVPAGTKTVNLDARGAAGNGARPSRSSGAPRCGSALIRARGAGHARPGCRARRCASSSRTAQPGPR
jgi:hypothetical protein